MATTKKNPDGTPKSFADIPARDASLAKLEVVDARIEVLDQKLTNHMDQLIKTVDNLAVQVGQLNGAVKQQSQNIDKLTQAIENGFARLERAIDSDREMIKQMMVLAASQQQTVNSLIAKLAA